ncbi:MAG: hypothetical protein HOV80_34145 [Polyangiaceae bacterium]|nr:hypothetical protein [Polyangiaceae bacterium]
MKKLVLASPLFALALLTSGVGCSDEGSCERIVEACHSLDHGAGPAHECHEFAESEEATDELCAEREDQCVEEDCNP